MPVGAGMEEWGFNGCLSLGCDVIGGQVGMLFQLAANVDLVGGKARE